MLAGDGPHGFSPLMEHFLAGQLAAQRELTYFFAPEHQLLQAVRAPAASPRPRSPGARTTAPARCGWSATARRCGWRTGCPGGDVNPYLAVAALIAAGLHGIENGLPLEPSSPATPTTRTSRGCPANLRDAADAVRRQRARRGRVRHGGRRALRQRRPRRARRLRRGRHRLGAAAVASSGCEHPAAARPAPATRRPLIGLTTYRERAVTGVWDSRVRAAAQRLRRRRGAGGRRPGAAAAAGTRRRRGRRRASTAWCWPAGRTSTRTRYRQRPAPARPRSSASGRDDWELRAARRARWRPTCPVLGVCRGRAAAQRGARRHASTSTSPTRVGHAAAPARPPAVFGTRRRVTVSPGSVLAPAARPRPYRAPATTTRPSTELGAGARWRPRWSDDDDGRGGRDARQRASPSACSGIPRQDGGRPAAVRGAGRGGRRQEQHRNRGRMTDNEPCPRP